MEKLPQEEKLIRKSRNRERKVRRNAEKEIEKVKFNFTRKRKANEDIDFLLSSLQSPSIAILD